MSNIFSDVQLWPVKAAAGNLLANGKVTMHGTVEVRFQVVKGSKGPFASLPARKSNIKDESGKEKWFPEVRILNDELYTEFQNLVKNTYENLNEPNKQKDDGVPF